MQNATIVKDISCIAVKLLLVTLGILLFARVSCEAQSGGKLDSLKSALQQHTLKDTIYLNILIAVASQQRHEDIQLAKDYYNEALSLSK